MRCAAYTPRLRQPSIVADAGNLVLLTTLYLLQGIPFGLSDKGIPLMVKDRVTYTDYMWLSYVTWPYVFKLLWAPLVDTIYSLRFGRRKSWIIPVQFLAAFGFAYLAFYIAPVIDDHTLGHINVPTVAVSLFFVVLCMACQDVAVDGWALTMVRRENIVYSSASQNIGLSAGYLLSYVILLALNSREFCHAYLGYDEGQNALTLGSFLKLSSVAFFVVTIYTWFFKTEEPLSENPVPPGKAYHMLWKITQNSNVQLLSAVLLVSKAGFVAIDTIMPVKIVERGFPIENLALIALVAFPFDILFSLVVTHLGNKYGPMNLWIMAYAGRIVQTIIAVSIFYNMPEHIEHCSDWTLAIFVYSMLAMFMSKVMFVAQGGFFAKVSDPAIGGMYQTLLNSVSNMGGNWPVPIGWYVCGYMTVRSCATADGIAVMCDTEQECRDAGATCTIERDGFYVVAAVSTVIGILLFAPLRLWIQRLQQCSEEDWVIVKPKKRKKAVGGVGAKKEV
eukprot:GFYU01006034.1.p1 GENE.GFYU01006034.1~~GFYU01006034.1.p1  ORF type:complete len:504 (-),score=102.74 GFYU01006034.1:121-1632(-)